MNTLIVDDSKTDRTALALMLKLMPGMAVAGEAANLADARTLLETPDIDLVFLDVELGRENGFELVQHLPKHARVVFTTVHKGFGPDAFEVGALDYLLKPVREERLFMTLHRAAAALGRPSSGLQRIAVHRSGSAHHYLPAAEISAVIADGNYSKVVCGPALYPDHRRLRDWQSILSRQGFDRLDRSHLVGIDHIEAVRLHGSGCVLKVRSLAGGIPLGPTACQRLRKLGFR